MVVVSYSGKEINAKLVYYGAGLSGKTTNLESIYEAVPDTSRGKMVSMKTQSDRTLFFDLLPLDLGEIMGFKTRFLLYTVPGQVFYNATRKLVLKGADAVVFVADSEVGKMDENRESLGNLRTNLSEYGLRLEEIPWVLQYNKRDLDNVYSVEDLNAALNPDGTVPWFEAVANQGKGVFETFRGVSHLLMEKVTRDLRRTPLTGPGSRGRAADTHAPAPSDPLGLSGLAPAAADAAPAAEFRMDFGRELTLPGPGPVSSTPAATAAPERAAPPALRRPEVATAPSAAARPAVAPPPPAHPPQSFAPTVVAQAPPLSPAMLQPEPFLTGVRPQSAPAAAPARPGLHTEHVELAHDTSADVTEAVIPITIAAGASREIVLRIVITHSE